MTKIKLKSKFALRMKHFGCLSQIAVVFERDKSVIFRHLSNIFKEQELLKDSVVAKKATTANDGKTYQVEFYNLDAILSVGARTGWFGLVSICLVLLNLDYPCNVSSLSLKPITTLLDYGGQFRIPLG